MKKVTIPTCANPFVVIVNGMKYTYPAGETVEVPDDVAAVIEQHHDAHNNPKPEPATPPYSSGAKSWNDLEDKPFGEEVVMTNVINWDGADGTVVGDFHFVSSATPTSEQFIGCSIVVNEGEGDVTFIVDGEAIMPVSDDVSIVVATETSFLVVVYADNTEFEEDVVFPKKGMYFAETIKSITFGEEIEKTVVKKIDEKYISGVTIPHVRITTVFDGGSIAIPRLDSDKLSAAYKTGLPVIISFAFGLNKICAFFSRYHNRAMDTFEFVSTVNSVEYMFFNDDALNIDTGSERAWKFDVHSVLQ